MTLHTSQILLLFSHSVMSNSLWPHGLQYRRLPCPSLSPGICSNSYPLSQWCHPTISSSVTPFSSCLQSFPESGSFPMRWLFPLGDQSIGASTSASVLPLAIQGWFPLRLTGLDLLAAQGTLKSLLQHHSRSLFSKWSESEVILSGTSLSSSYWSWRRLLVLTGLALSKPPTV